MTTTSPAKDERKPQARSRVTNGSSLLPGVDGRSVWARRMRDVIESLSDDMGGSDSLTEAQSSIVRRCAALTVELERMEGNFANAGEAAATDLQLYNTVAGNLRRLLESIGLERRAKAMKDITPGPLSSRGRRVLPPDSNDLGGGLSAAAEDFDLARRITFMVERALRSGDPLPEPIATLAAEAGLVKLAPDDGGVTVAAD